MRQISFVILATVMYLSGTAVAQKSPSLPSSPDAWVNSPPLSKEKLRGKAIYLLFFEET